MKTVLAALSVFAVIQIGVSDSGDRLTLGDSRAFCLKLHNLERNYIKEKTVDEIIVEDDDAIIAYYDCAMKKVGILDENYIVDLDILSAIVQEVQLERNGEEVADINTVVENIIEDYQKDPLTEDKYKGKLLRNLIYKNLKS